MALKNSMEMIDIKELIPYANNAREHSELQVNQIVASIKEFGFTNPLLIDEGKGIIAGHGRLMAAKKAELTDVPCIVLDNLTDAQKKALVLADNKLAMNATWDEELLTAELMTLKDMEFDLDLIGFDENELADLLDIEPDSYGCDEDDVPDVPEKPVSALGDIWQLGDHRLMCGDSTDAGSVALLMDGQKADMVFTDPPYGIDVVQGKKSTIGGGGATKFDTGTVGGGRIVAAKTYKKIAGDDTTDVA